MPFDAEASVADKRRFTPQRTTLIESQTAALDRWYAAQIISDLPAVAQRLNDQGSVLVSDLSRQASRGGRRERRA